QLISKLSLHDALPIYLLTFDSIFEEPLGYYLIKCFLTSDINIDKVIFIKDVKIFKTLNDPTIRKSIAKLIYESYCKEDIKTSNRSEEHTSELQSRENL